jgi:hypothetical protein
VAPQKESSTTRNGLKASPLTVGGLVFLAGLVVGVVTLGFAVMGKVDSTAASAVMAHEVKDVDNAHQGLPKRYVCKRELLEALSRISEKISGVRSDVRELRVEVAKNGRGTRRRSGR